MQGDDNAVLPRRILDTRGHLIPLTAEEIRERNAEAIRALDDIAGMTDETDTADVWAEVYRGIDEARPQRPLFEGMY